MADDDGEGVVVGGAVEDMLGAEVALDKILVVACRATKTAPSTTAAGSKAMVTDRIRR